MGEAFIHCFYLPLCYYIRSIKNLSCAYITHLYEATPHPPGTHTHTHTQTRVRPALPPPPPRSLSLRLVCNYEGKTKESDSSCCRGPLMMSLK